MRYTAPARPRSDNTRQCESEAWLRRLIRASVRCRHTVPHSRAATAGSESAAVDACVIPYPMQSLDVHAVQLSVKRCTTPSLRYRSTMAATTLSVNSTKYLMVVLPRLVACPLPLSVVQQPATPQPPRQHEHSSLHTQHAHAAAQLVATLAAQLTTRPIVATIEELAGKKSYRIQGAKSRGLV